MKVEIIIVIFQDAKDYLFYSGSNRRWYRFSPVGGISLLPY
jgi:hypothetical protein